MSNENKTSIGEVLCDVRKSFRILALFSERVCKLIQYIGNRMGLEYLGDKNLGDWEVLALRNNYQDNREKEPFAWLPMYYRSFRLSTPHIEIRLIVWPDTGPWEMEEGSTDVKDFPDVSKSSSRLVFVIANEADIAELELNVDLADRWDEAAVENSGEFSFPVSEKSDKKAFYKVFDLADFENKEATDKALQAFVDYANKNGFGLKLKSDTEKGET
jgi:hypothetical protein